MTDNQRPVKETTMILSSVGLEHGWWPGAARFRGLEAVAHDQLEQNGLPKVRRRSSAGSGPARTAALLVRNAAADGSARTARYHGEDRPGWPFRLSLNALLTLAHPEIRFPGHEDSSRLGWFS